MSNSKSQKNILTFLHEAENLKSVLRHSWLSSGRRESVAEHTWRMALMAIVLHQNLKNKPDLLKTLKMVLVHDLGEIYAGDIWAFKKAKANKLKLEEAAIKKIVKSLEPKIRKELIKLWQEAEAGNTKEAKFVKALDRLEVLIQHNEADIKHLNRKELKFNFVHGLEQCAYDPFLKNMRQLLNKEFLKNYKKHKVDPKFYKSD